MSTGGAADGNEEGPPKIFGGPSYFGATDQRTGRSLPSILTLRTDGVGQIIHQESRPPEFTTTRYVEGAEIYHQLQMTALRVAEDQVALVFTKILDHVVLGTDEEDRAEPTDRDHWEKRAAPTVRVWVPTGPGPGSNSTDFSAAVYDVFVATGDRQAAKASTGRSRDGHRPLTRDTPWDRDARLQRTGRSQCLQQRTATPQA